MTDREFKRLSRSQLIEIIYQLQLKQDELTAANESLTRALADRRILIDNAGSIADAAFELHKVMQAAQDAAAHYSEELQTRADEEYRRRLEEAENKAHEIIESAQKQADEIVAQAKQENPDR